MNRPAAARGSDPHRPAGPVVRRDRRVAALVAYLSLEGPTPRSRLAGLLWPDVPEATARNNLSQALRRGRQSGMGAPFRGDDPLSLVAALEPDEALELLRPHSYDDLPEFGDWLLGAQERRRVARAAELRTEVRRLEKAGELRSALDLGEVWLDLAPVSEDVHRHLMRLHHLLGDRAGALAAYRRCVATLRRELGVEPGPETASLAAEIERSVLPVPGGRTLPLSVQRPPRLIGREEAWRAMERAWAEGRGIFLSGEAGVGKTRLLRDFMAAHGQQVIFQARPGDRLVAYSTHARSYSALLRQLPGLPLPDWVRRELSRIVPGLRDAPDTGDLPPIAGDADKLRFYQAKTEVLQLAAAAGMGALAFDDLQFIDPASAEAGEYTLAGFWGDEGARLRTIHAFRTGELPAELEARLDTLVAAGLAVRIDLEPLTPAQATDLLNSLEVPELRIQVAGLARATGSNPLALLETARHVLGAGDAGDGTGRPHLPLRHLSELTRQRLERLSPAAVSLARAAAVLGTDTAAETAAQMLDLAPLALADPWRELEAAQVLVGSAFTHDLLQEAVLQGLSTPLRALLHRRAALALEVLESARAAPARIAHHWRAGAEPGRAAPHWFGAARIAAGQFRLDEAAVLFGEAVEAYSTVGDHEAAIDALEQQSVALWETQAPEVHRVTVTHIDTLARTPAQHARARRLQARLQYRLRDWTAAAAEAQAGLDLLAGAAPSELSVSLLEIVGLTDWQQGRLDRASAVLTEVEAGFGLLGLTAEQAGAINNLALVLDYQGRRQAAAGRYAEAVRLFRQLGLLDQQAIVLGSWGSSLMQGGRAREALEPLREAFRLGREVQGAPNVERRIRTQLGAALTVLGEFREAEQQLQAALDLARRHGLIQSFVHARLGDLYGRLGRTGEALEQLALAAQEQTAAAERTLNDLSEARVLTLAGRDASPALEQARQRLPDGAPASTRLRLRLAQAGQQAPDQALLALGEPSPALEHARQGRALLQTYNTLDLPWPESELAYLAGLEALADVSAPASRQAAQERLQREAEEQLADEERRAFLALPMHRALLGAAHVPVWHPLTDAQWAGVENLLASPTTGTGRPRREVRAVLDGVLWALMTSAAWNRPFPAHLPSSATCYRRFREWQQSGVLDRIQGRLNGRDG